MKILKMLPYAFVGWMLCGAMVGIGRELTTIENALIIHLIGAPIVFAVLTKIYYKKNNNISSLQLAIYMLSFVILMDVFVVSLLIEKNFDMFKSLIGTWIPFVLMFLAIFLVGKREDKNITSTCTVNECQR
jgi:hypothetical protein